LTSAERAKDKRLRDIYNTTLEAQNEQRAKQGNRCAICRRDFAKFTAFQDHEHKCCPRRLKKFCGRCNRSLLCFSCNKFVVGVLERQSVDGKKLNPLWLLKQIIAYFEYWNPILKAKGCYEEKPKEKTAVSRKKKRIR
jgi:hypothetical protein